MLIFRSEDHVERWLEQKGRTKGELMSSEQQWQLSDAWYSNRAHPDWRRRTPEEAEALFEELGLSGEFWKLTP